MPIMDMKIFVVISLFQVSAVASKNCVCYVGWATSSGSVRIKLSSCSAENVTPSAAYTQKTASTVLPATTTVKLSTHHTTEEQDEPSATLTPDATTNEYQPVQTTKQELSTTKTQSTSAASDSGRKSRKKRDDNPTPPPCCQILIAQTEDKLYFNNLWWNATFTCYDGSSDKVCNTIGCNDLKFLQYHIKYDVALPNNCMKQYYIDTSKKADGFMFESNGTDKVIAACNNFSEDKCSRLSLTENHCSQDGCCCPLAIGTCTSMVTTTTTVNPSAASQHPRKPKSPNKQQSKSFNWKIIGYIATGIACGVFLTILVRFIYGKKKNSGLVIPNYKYSRLSADYVADDEQF
ncbi:uncharacterized protein [Antedon mediterranea]|uniref:uncharacterized protein n=1 Tax=Antedon mediterranea TaxID=105859 RepID=UPI003AF520B9